jgi:hypothetical protein
MKSFSIYAISVIAFFALISCVENPWDDGGYTGGGHHGGGRKDTVVIDTTIGKDTTVYRDTTVYKDTTVYNDTTFTKLGIVGEWDWEYTTGGIAGVYQTPASQGYTIKYIFNSDFTYYKIKDNQIIERGEYTTYQKYSRYEGTTQNYLELFSAKSSSSERFIMNFQYINGEEHLSLSQDAADGFNYSYKRVK